MNENGKYSVYVVLVIVFLGLTYVIQSVDCATGGKCRYANRDLGEKVLATLERLAR